MYVMDRGLSWPTLWLLQMWSVMRGWGVRSDTESSNLPGDGQLNKSTHFVSRERCLKSLPAKPLDIPKQHIGRIGNCIDQGEIVILTKAIICMKKGYWFFIKLKWANLTNLFSSIDSEKVLILPLYSLWLIQ